MKLSDVQGHQHLCHVFQRLHQRGRMPQSIILEGMPGCGRRTLALALAQAHVCKNPQAGDSCGRCKSCLLMEERIPRPTDESGLQVAHPDCTLMQHDTESKSISVGALRDEVVDRASESALMGNGRVFIIPSIERLKASAINVLLKVLEEPPVGVLIIATCTQRESLLPTIRSRCQIYRLAALSQEAVCAVLQRQGVQDAQRLSQTAHGSHRGVVRSTGAEDGHQAPLAELQALLFDGYESALVSQVCDRLPTTVPKHMEMTLPAYRRHVCAPWFDELIYVLRARLRKHGDMKTVEAIECVVRQKYALDVNIDPRMVFEGLALLV